MAANAEKTRKSGPAYRRRKEQRPQEILAAGLEEFYEHGFASASLSRIAQRAGISRATLYLYFEGKDALFLAVADHALFSLTEGAAQQVQSDDASTAETLRMLFGNFYKVMTTTKNSALMRILISEGPDMPELVDKYHEIVLSRGRTLLETIIARGIERGEVRPSAATECPELLIAPVMFYTIHSMIFTNQPQMPVEAFMEGHLEMVLHGISAEPGCAR